MAAIRTSDMGLLPRCFQINAPVPNMRTVETTTPLQTVDVAESAFAGPGGHLHRRSYRPKGDCVAHLAVIHGYGDHSGRHAHFMRWMAERGVACDAVDLRGQGLSEGRRGYVSRWTEYVDDLQAFLNETGPGDRLPRFALGHSHGALVVAVAGEMGVLGAAHVRGSILTSPYFRGRMKIPIWKETLGRCVGLIVPWLPLATGLNNEWMSSDPQMVAQSKNDPLCTRVATPRWYLGMLKAQKRVLEKAGDFRLPLLVFGAGEDLIAETSVAEEFVRRSGSADKEFRLCADMRHEILRERGREAIFNEILQWIQKRTPPN